MVFPDMDASPEVRLVEPIYRSSDGVKCNPGPSINLEFAHHFAGSHASYRHTHMLLTHRRSALAADESGQDKPIGDGEGPCRKPVSLIDGGFKTGQRLSR